MEDKTVVNTSQLSRSQLFYRANKERINAKRCAKYRSDVAKSKAVKTITKKIEALYAGLTGDNFIVVMESHDLRDKYNDIISAVRKKYLEEIKRV